MLQSEEQDRGAFVSVEIAVSAAPPVAAPLPGERFFRTGRRHIVGVTPRKARVFSRLRDLDWGMAALALFLGFLMFQSEAHIQVGTDGSWTAGISTRGWGWILIGVGTIRILALRINGLWQTSVSAGIRGAAALVGMMFWGQIFYVYALANYAGGSLITVETVVFGWFWLAELRCVMRALDDVSSIRRVSRRARETADAGV